MLTKCQRRDGESKMSTTLTGQHEGSLWVCILTVLRSISRFGFANCYLWRSWWVVQGISVFFFITACKPKIFSKKKSLKEFYIFNQILVSLWNIFYFKKCHFSLLCFVIPLILFQDPITALLSFASTDLWAIFPVNGYICFLQTISCLTTYAAGKEFLNISI